MKCPECDFEISKSDEFCRNCGVIFSDDFQKQLFRCPFCNSVLTESEDICPFCGSDQSSSPELSDSTISPPPSRNDQDEEKLSSGKKITNNTNLDFDSSYSTDKENPQLPKSNSKSIKKASTSAIKSNSKSIFGLGIRLRPWKVVIIITVVVILLVSSLSFRLFSPSSTQVVLNEKLRVPERDSNLQNVIFGNDSISYQYSNQPASMNYSIGDFIAGTTGNGYLRRIVDMHISGNTVTLLTENASLSDVIQQGNIHLEKTVTPTMASSSSQVSAMSISRSEVVGNEPLFYDLTNNFKLNAAQINVTGNARFDLKFIIDASFDWFTLKSFKCAVQLNYDLSLGISSNMDITLSAEKVLRTIHFNPITFWVGVPPITLPIVIAPIFQTAVGVEVQLQSSLEASISSSMSATAGIEYKNGQFYPINEITQQTTPSVTNAVIGNATGYAVVPRILLMLYGFIGPQMDFKPYLRFEVAKIQGSQDLAWSLYFGAKGEASLRMGILDEEIATSDPLELFKLDEWKLKSGTIQAGTLTVPSAPQNLIAVPGDTQISLSWQLPSNNGGASVSSYRLYRGTSSGSESLLIILGNVSSYQNTALTNGITYYYQVSAINAIGEGQRSNEAAGIPATISWTTSTIDIGSIGGGGIAIDSNNKIHITYLGDYHVLKYATNAAGSWSTYTIDSAQAMDYIQSIAIDSNNKVHMSYCDYWSNFDLKYATNAAGSWSIYTIDSTGEVGDFNSIAIDSNNKVHMSYYDKTNSNLKYATNAAGSWSMYTIDNVGDVGEFNNIAIDSNNKVHMSYYDSTNMALKYATNAAGSWSTYTIDSGVDVGIDSDIAIDSNNKVHISYEDWTNNNLKYATNAAGSWSIYTIDSAGDVGGYSSIAIDSNNKVHIGYFDWANCDLKYATNSAGSWSTYTIDSGGDIGESSSIAIDSNNKVHISYYDWTNGNLKYATNA